MADCGCGMKFSGGRRRKTRRVKKSKKHTRKVHKVRKH